MFPSKQYEINQRDLRGTMTYKAKSGSSHKVNSYLQVIVYCQTFCEISGAIGGTKHKEKTVSGIEQTHHYICGDNREHRNIVVGK